MTDKELQEALGLSDDEAKVIIPKLTPEKRAAYEALHVKYVEIMLWEQGVSPLPAGVIVCGPRQIRRR